jgi:hypothetical protein
MRRGREGGEGGEGRDRFGGSEATSERGKAVQRRRGRRRRRRRRRRRINRRGNQRRREIIASHPIEQVHHNPLEKPLLISLGFDRRQPFSIPSTNQNLEIPFRDFRPVPFLQDIDDPEIVATRTLHFRRCESAGKTLFQPTI